MLNLGLRRIELIGRDWNIVWGVIKSVGSLHRRELCSVKLSSTGKKTRKTGRWDIGNWDFRIF